MLAIFLQLKGGVGNDGKGKRHFCRKMREEDPRRTGTGSGDSEDDLESLLPTLDLACAAGTEQPPFARCPATLGDQRTFILSLDAPRLRHCAVDNLQALQ